MNKKQIVGLVIATTLFIVTGVISVATNHLLKKATPDMDQILSAADSFNPPLTDYMAIVEVVGVIQEQTDPGMFSAPVGYQHDTTMEYIDDLMRDRNNKGILLYVDSPGGTVYESEEIYQKLMDYKSATGRPVWCYMAHYAASGGYYIAAAADRIYANPNTVTGSIGVIMATFDFTGLYEKLGIEYVSITSGDYKDSSQMTEEHKAIYQSQVDEAYEAFVGVIAKGRDMDPATVKTLADGRTYTAKQALEHDLIDGIGRYEEIKDQIREEEGIYQFYLPEDNAVPGWASLFSSLKDAAPKSEAQVLAELAEKTQGGLLYHANLE